MDRPSKRALELQTAAAQAARGLVTSDSGGLAYFTPTPTKGIAVRRTPPVAVGSPSPVASVAPVSEVVYQVVTATPSPVPTVTPNPYASLHLTLTRIWYLATTATPYAATQIFRPLYYQGSAECFANCGFVTSTATYVFQGQN